ncbi:type IV pilus assembly protein PilN [Vibrio orientalis CIP 102891 = ATCC 33934]|uniref:Type IV pilus assembly protein PilN n=1 Tax=Vibrio orientalis CIP 102891 = ATCC 33934 TaxID=675816 RepID=C9QNG8_VIBOR|nr:PilN domain-containing protein [Vibrio orientalis]EEX93495.1 type IV pilus biogenesis protein PilN [Vibrio orientalis CIP 102891 = ATCC 33934]EGU50278.1 type IV pilus assembly protein PilN [Vibrio orientalis CIP 102891 = ATCC 33934]
MLHSINLLPWRQGLRRRHKQRFFALLVTALFIAFLLQWLAGQYLFSQGQIQQSRLSYLNRYISQLDVRIKQLSRLEQDHGALLTRLQVVERLQGLRNKTTDFMNALPSFIPQGVYVDKINMSGHQVQMSGISETTSRLASMLEKLEKSPLVSKVAMHSIVHGEVRFEQKFQTFNLSFSFQSPSEAAGAQR